MPTLFNQLLENLDKVKAQGFIDDAETNAIAAIIYVDFSLEAIKQKAEYVPHDEIEMLLNTLRSLSKNSPVVPELLTRLVALVDLACLRDAENKLTYLTTFGAAVKDLSLDAFKVLSKDEASPTVVYLLESVNPTAQVSVRRAAYQLEEINLLIDAVLEDALTHKYFATTPKSVEDAYLSLKETIRVIFEEKNTVESLKGHLKTLFESYSKSTIDDKLFAVLLRTVSELSEPIIDKSKFARLSLEVYQSVYSTYRRKDYRQNIMLEGARGLLEVLDDSLSHNGLLGLIKQEPPFYLADPQASEQDDAFSDYAVTMSFFEGVAVGKWDAKVSRAQLFTMSKPEIFLGLLRLSQPNLSGIQTINELISQENPDLLVPFKEMLKHFNEVNAKVDVHQSRNVTVFFFKYYNKVQQFIGLTGVLGIKHMQQMIANTVLPLEQMLEGMPILDPSLLEPLKSYVNSHIKTSKALEIFKGCLIAIGAIAKIEEDTFLYPEPDSEETLEKLIMGMAQDNTPQEFLNVLVQYVLNKMLPNLDIEIDESFVNKLFKQIAIDKLMNLIAASQTMERDEYREVFLEFLKIDLLGGNPDALLHDLNQDSHVGQEVARHNQAIRDALEKQGIIPEEALNYKKTYDFMLLPLGASGQELDSDNQYLVLWNYLEQLNEEAKLALNAEPSSKELLQPLMDNIKQLQDQINKKTKSGSAIKKAAAVVLSKDSNLDAIIGKNIIRNCLNKLQSSASRLPRSFFEFAGHTTEQFKLIKSLLAAEPSQRGNASERSRDSEPLYISVVQWDKNNRDTFFLGDEVGCCLATNGTQFQAIVQRRLDDAMLFHVAMDKTTGKPVALIWLYLAKTTDNKIVLIANFFEVKTKFGLNEYHRKALLNGLLQFTNQYLADNPGIAGFYMNQLTYGWNKGDLSAYPIEPLAIADKLGGAYIPGGVPAYLDREDPTVKEQIQRLTQTKYFLVSLWAATFHEFSPDILALTKQENILAVEELLQKTVLDLFAKKPRSLDEILVEVLRLHRIKLEYFFSKPLEKNQYFLNALENFHENAAIMQKTGGKVRSSVEMLQTEHAFFSRLNQAPGAASDLDAEVAPDVKKPDDKLLDETPDRPRSR